MTSTSLTRNLDEAMLGGVLAGIASKYDWDPTLVRIVAVLIGLATGVVPAVVLYLVAWAIIPRSGALPAGAAAETTETAESMGATEPGEATQVPPTAPPSGPAAVADEVAGALRDAADRLGEAATIAADAARQAANEIGEVARRPRSVAVEEPPASDAAADVPVSEAGDDESEGDEARGDDTEGDPAP